MFERLLMKIRGKNSDADLRWCIDHGFRHGDNFNCFTPDAIDSNYPWLITVGDNVTISSDVKILAHDASTLLTKSHTKVGIVNIGDNVFIGAGTIVLCNTRIGDNVDDYKAKHERALKTHRYFTERWWYDWKNATPTEWETMREQLSDTWGYVGEKLP